MTANPTSCAWSPTFSTIMLRASHDCCGRLPRYCNGWWFLVECICSVCIYHTLFLFFSTVLGSFDASVGLEGGQDAWYCPQRLQLSPIALVLLLGQGMMVGFCGGTAYHMSHMSTIAQSAYKAQTSNNMKNDAWYRAAAPVPLTLRPSWQSVFDQVGILCYAAFMHVAAPVCTHTYIHPLRTQVPSTFPRNPDGSLALT